MSELASESSSTATPPRPFPGDVAPDRVDEPFWAACRERRFLLHTCGLCGTAVWPAGSCPAHGGSAMAWTGAGGLARLHSWTVVHQRYATTFDDGQAVVAVVRLDEGPLMHANVVSADALALGMRLQVDYREIGPAVVVPVFRPAVEEER